MAPRDDDKAMDGLLRRSLARDAGRAAAGDTLRPAPDILAAYSENPLDPAHAAHYDLHFSTCPKCRKQLAAIFRAQAVMQVPAEVEELAAPAVPAAAPTAAAKAAPPARSWTMHL